MKELKQNILIFLVALILVTLLIKSQKAQRRCNIEPEVLGIGQHKEVYYQYQDYLKERGER